MAKLRINYKLIIVLVIGLAILAGSAIGLRKWFRTQTVATGYSQGKAAYQKQQWDEAANQLGNYLAVRKDDSEILMMYADAQLKRRPISRGNIQQAISAYRQVSRLDASDALNTESVRILTDIYLEMGAFSEARAKAEEFLTSSQDLQVSLNLVKSQLGLRDFKLAYQQLVSMVEQHPDFIPAYELLAVYSGRYPEHFKQPAKYWYEKAVQANPDSANAYIIEAAWYSRNNLKTEAQKCLDRAVELKTGDQDVRLRLARELIIAGRQNQAQSILEEIQKQSPSNVDLWKTKALLVLSLNDKKQMGAVAEEALKNLGYNSWDFLTIACEMFIDAGNYEQAENVVSQLSTLEDSRAQVLYYKGLIENQKSNKTEAIKCLREAIDLGYKTPRARIILAGAYAETGDLTSGIQQLRALTSEVPDNFEALLSLAKLLAQNEDPSGAAEKAMNALQLNPTSAEAILLYTQSRMKILSATGISKDSPEWIALEERLQSFGESNAAQENVILSQLKIAIRRNDIEKANAINQKLKAGYPDSVSAYIGDVEILLYEGKTEQAEKILVDLINKFPDEPEPVIYLVQILYSNEKIEDCYNMLKKAIETTKQSRHKLQLGILFADIARSAGKESEAFGVVSAIDQQFPDSIVVKRKLLAFKQTQNDKQKTEQLIEQIKQIEGEKGWQWKYEKAKQLYLSDPSVNYAEIVKFLKDAVAIEPAAKEPQLMLGALYAQNGDLLAAISIYRQSLNRWPNDPQVIAPLAASLYRANEFEQAEQLLKQASQMRIKTPAMEKLEMHSLMMSGNRQAVSDMLKDAIKADPNDKDSKLSLALLYMRDGNFEKSQEMLDTLKSQQENSFVVDTAQIELLIRQGLKDKAFQACDVLVDNYKTGQAYMIRGRNYLLAGDANTAGKDFAKAVEIEPKNEEAWLLLSGYYETVGSKEKVLETINNAIKVLPDSSRILKKAIYVYGASDNIENQNYAGQLIESAVKANPEDVDLKLIQARFLISKSNPVSLQQAQNILEKLTEDYPNLTQGWYLLSQACLMLGDAEKSAYYAERGLVYSPSDKELSLIKAKALLITSPFSAVKILENLNIANPNDVQIMLPLAEAQIQTGNASQAAKMLDESLKFVNPKDIRNIKMMLASALEMDNKSEQANEIFGQLASESDDQILLYTRVRLLIKQKRWYDLSELVGKWTLKEKEKIGASLSIARQLMGMDDIEAHKTAEEILIRLNAIDTKNLEVLGSLGIVYQMNGKFAQSTQMYQEIINIQPENIVALNNLAWIVSEQQGNYVEALKLASDGLVKNPDYEELLDTRGVIYFRMGEFDKAVEDFLKCLKLIPPGKIEAAGTYFHLGRTYSEMGDKIKAVENLNMALTLDPTGKVLSADDIASIRRLLYKLKNQ
jgi:tetratricopeptide (TPR) repeat protein